MREPRAGPLPSVPYDVSTREGKTRYIEIDEDQNLQMKLDKGYSSERTTWKQPYYHSGSSSETEVSEDEIASMLEQPRDGISDDGSSRSSKTMYFGRDHVFRTDLSNGNTCSSEGEELPEAVSNKPERKIPGLAMAQPNPRVTMRPVRAQADAVVSACNRMERPPADIEVVAKISAIAKKILSLIDQRMQSEELFRCQKGLRSLRSMVSAASAGARRADRAGTGGSTSELRSRVAAEQQMLQEIYDAFASLGRSSSINIEGGLRRMEEGMDDLGRLAGEAKEKFSSTGSGEQNNYVNESTGTQNNYCNKSTGTQNNNIDNHAPVYFGQNMRFHRGDRAGNSVATKLSRHGKCNLSRERSERLERMAKEGKEKHSSSGSEEQYNNVNESSGTQTVTNNHNRNSENFAPVYFGQGHTFYRDE